MPAPSEHAEYPRPSQASLLRRTLRWAALGYCLAAAGESSATAMRYRHNAPESPLDQRYEYQWAVLRRALEITAPQYGPYVLEPGRLMNEQRQVHEMQQGTGALSVIYLDTSPTLEATLSPVRIPVDKGVVGFRVLLIRKEQLAKFHRDFTVRDLAGMRFGAGAGWVDVDILRANGLQVVTGSNYDGLFAMLEHGRFDAFPRGANEILGEFNAQGSRFPSLAIEEHLLIQYPQPMYFWFSRSAEGRRLGERAEAGLRRMLDDGTFDALFHQYHQNAIEALRLHQRRIIRLTNPLLGPDTPLHDRRLWFDPQAAAPPTP